MEILQSKSIFFSKIRHLIKRDAEVNIATYNIFTGILDDGRYTNDWGGKFFNEVGALFDNLSLKNCKTHIKIGIPRPFKCQLYEEMIDSDEPHNFDASHCSSVSKSEKWDARFEHIKNRWNRLKFSVVDNSHIKLILVSPNHYIIGGRNLSNSEDKDLSFYGFNQETYDQLLNIFNTLE